MTRGLAELFGAAGQVEHIVHDLKGQTKIIAVAAQRRDRLFRRARR